MRVLIAGATGFTGVNLVRHFAKRGAYVTGVDRVSADALCKWFVRDCNDRIEFIEADLCDPGWHAEVLHSKFDVAIHAAAVSNPRGTEEIVRAADAVRVNVGTVAGLVQWAASVHAARVIYVSGLVVDAPRNTFAITKYAGERVALRVAQLASVQGIVARYTSGYGDMERATRDRAYTSIPHILCEAAIRNSEAVLPQMQGTREYTHIADVAEAIYELAVAPELKTDLYEISSGTSMQTDQLIEEVRKHFPALRVRLEPTSSRDGSSRPAATEALRSDTQWKPRYDLERGLADYLDWLNAAMEAGLLT